MVIVSVTLAQLQSAVSISVANIHTVLYAVSHGFVDTALAFVSRDTADKNIEAPVFKLVENVTETQFTAAMTAAGVTLNLRVEDIR